VRIQDLARQMIRLAGLVPEVDVAIAFTGIRPGEKMHEELVYDDETLAPTARQGINVAAGRPAAFGDLRHRLEELIAHASAGEAEDSVARLAMLVPEFRRVDG